MQRSLLRRGEPHSWYGQVIFITALVQLVLVCASLIMSCCASDDTYQPHITEFLIILPLLGYAGLGWYTRQVLPPFSAPLFSISTLFGCVQGIILGLLLLLPYPYISTQVILEAVWLPMIISGSFLAHTHVHPQMLIVLIHTFISLLSYSVCAFWATRRTRSVLYGYVSALLAAFSATLITTLSVAIIYHAPLVLSTQPNTNSFYAAFPAGDPFPVPLNYLASYHNLIGSAITILLSQFMLAIFAGLLGCLPARYKLTQPEPAWEV